MKVKRVHAGLDALYLITRQEIINGSDEAIWL